MDKELEAFLQELMGDFKIEAAEHYLKISHGLIELEKMPQDSVAINLIETIFREIHSMKGSARAVNVLDVEKLCQGMESIFHHLKNASLALSPHVFDALFIASDALNVLLTEIDKPEKSIGSKSLSQILKRLESLINPDSVVPSVQTHTSEVLEREIVKVPMPAESNPVPDKPATVLTKETIRVSLSKLEKLLVEAEEFITFKSTLNHYIGRLEQQSHKDILPTVRELKRLSRAMSRRLDDLLFDIKTTLLHPFSNLLEIVPRIVRDLGKEFNKEINLLIHGSEIEIDRRILEELKDPIIHLIRNCIDHGFESRATRISKGKNPTGTLSILVHQESPTQIELIISDDGAGIDVEKVIRSAIKSEIVTPESVEKMTQQEINNLIFRSGVSTSPYITDISGRGLGMAIVAEKVAKLGGEITMESETGTGTVFNIKLPVTIATFRGIHVRAGNSHFMIPTSAVERVLKVAKNDIRTVEGKEYVKLDSRNVVVARLTDILNVSTSRKSFSEETSLSTVLVVDSQKEMALIVEEIFSELEVQ